MNEDEVAQELRGRGWTQGSLVRVGSAPERTWIERVAADSAAHGDADTAQDASGTWVVRRESLEGCEFLVVASQLCDLLKPPSKEPMVDALATYWTTDGALIDSARRNSARYFVLETMGVSGRVTALVADAAHRIALDKRSLATLDPNTTFTSASGNAAHRFRVWLGGRLGRRPLPDELVRAVQQPLVNAVRKLKRSDARRAILDMIDYVLCQVVEEGPPLRVELLLVSREATEEPPFTVEEAARIADMFDKAMRARGAEMVAWERYTTMTISLYYFENAYEMALGEFSLSDEDAGSKAKKR